MPRDAAQHLQRPRAARAELRRWYTDELRPKVGRALAHGQIEAGEVIALDRQIGDLIGVKPAVLRSGRRLHRRP